MAFNFEQAMANWPPGNLDVGFPGRTGTQSVPGIQDQQGGIGGFFQNIQKNPELLAMALDQLGGIVNPSQGSEGLGTRLAKSSIASKAAQQQQARLTLPDQKGPTSESRKKVPGGTQVTSVTFEPDDDTIGGQLASRP